MNPKLKLDDLKLMYAGDSYTEETDTILTGMDVYVRHNPVQLDL